MIVKRTSVFMAVVLLIGVAAHAQLMTETLQSYPLPAEIKRSLGQIAAQNDLLILGEFHGTQEVPALAASLLAPLTKLGYNVLALEVPSDQQAPLTAWATGKTTKVPSFFTRPGSDGRANIQILTLIRTALSPPFRWHLICFDETEAAQERQFEELKRQAKQGPREKLLSTSQAALPEDIIALSLQRDAVMASNLGKQRQPLASPAKCLVICGNLHARTANHSTTDSPISALWPSFAAVVQRDHPVWKVSSVNIRFHSGGFFNGGKVNSIKESPLDKAVLRPVLDGDWKFELDLPHATPATFLAPPADDRPLPTKQ
jgi:hypothetical protein